MARVIDTARNSRFLLAALVLCHLVAISHQVDGGGGASLLERMVFAVLSPGQRLVAAVVGGVERSWSGYLDLRDVHEENGRLKDRVSSLETQLQQRQAAAAEAEQLREVLELRKILPLETVTAEVVARSGMPWFRTITVNKGLEAGIHLNTPVLSPTGIVGRVVAVGPRAAKVQTLLDQACGVGVMVERSRASGVVQGQVAFDDQGQGTTDLRMKYVSAIADVVVGDAVVTSGLDQVFPKGLVVGRVRSVAAPSGLFKEVIVTPSARFDEVEEVLLVRGGAETPALTQGVRPETAR
jgi:rod shape-determining protein MreC